MRAILVSILLLLGAAGPAGAAETEGTAVAAPSREIPAADELAPVPVPRASALALRYYVTGNWIWLADELWLLAVPTFLVASGLSARMERLARRIGRNWFFTVAVYLVLYLVLAFLIDLPLIYYQGYVRQHAYGLSHQSLARWFGVNLKRLGLSVVVVPLFAWVPFFLMRRSPRRWWLYTTLLTVPFAFFAMLVSPIWVDPLFNRYGPLADPVLEQKIQEQALRAGIEGSRIYQVDKSVDTKALNAYVKGVFDTKRIVLYDTLVERLDHREVLAVLGHEMGHYVLGHVHRTILLSSVLVLASLFWVDRAGRRLIARYRERFGFDDLSSIAAVPLVLALMQVSVLAFSPIACAYSRHQEHEADRFALELTRMNHSAGRAFVKLQQENLGNPRPGLFYTLFRATHPSIGDRIDFCNAYHPWTRGESLVYDGLFRR